MNSSVAIASPSLFEKVQQRTARVGVIGLGYVGLPTMMAAAQAGFVIKGIDVDQGRVDQINSGISYIDDVDGNTLADLLLANKISASSSFESVSQMDVLIICVPTPVDQHKEPELGPLRHAVHSLSKYMQGEQLIILQSTTYPGTTEELVLPELQKTGRQAGKDFYLVFSPERIDPGNRQYNIHNIPKVVGGVTPTCTKLGCAFFSSFVEKVVPVGSTQVAEMTKLLENVFRSVNIALVNELSEVCQRMNIDIWEVVNAAASKPFGFMPFYPGIGVGGHCIAVDPFYLSWKAKEHDCYVNFIDLAARINDNRPYYVVSRIADVLGDKGITLRDSCLLLLGMSFKSNVNDTRNSPAIRVAELLSQRGANVFYSDRQVPQLSLNGHSITSVELDRSTLERCDATIILVKHSSWDLNEVVKHSKLVLDAVDATRHLGPNTRVIKL